MERSNFVGWLAAGAIVAMATWGCGRTVVRPQQETAATGLPRPQRVLVYDFAFSAADVTENQAIGEKLVNAAGDSTADQRALAIGQDVSNTIAEDMVAGLQRLGLAAERASRDTPARDADLLVRGQLLDVNEGNRLRRLVIGFGAGSSTLDTQVFVYQASPQGRRSVLQFRTHTDSGKMPGAAVTMGAGAAAQGGATAGMAAANVTVGGVKSYRSQIEQLAGASADQAVAYLSELAGRQGWITPEQVEKAKVE